MSRLFIKGGGKEMTIKALVLGITASLFFITACSPKVGTEAWCLHMKEKPTGDWTANETGSYAKYCVMGLKPE